MREPLTFAQAMAEQGDLRSLCADRPLKTTEIFPPNAYYGTDRVLKTYAGVPLDCTLKVVLPHGIEYCDDYVWSSEIQAPLPVLIYHPRRRGRVLRERSSQVVLRAASPFLYVEDLVDTREMPEPRGTLFFPAHSTHWITALSEFDALAHRLEALPEKFHPISVCVYWRDFLLGHHEAFLRRGFRVVSAGHMYDSNFLFRLYYLCRLHRYAASNELGSHLFYSVKAGCSYFHLASEAKYIYDAARGTDLAQIPVDIRAKFEWMFSELRDELSPEQVGLIDEYTAADQRMSPATMREFFGFAEAIDRFGTATWEGQRHWVFPPALKRALWHRPRTIAGRALRFATGMLADRPLQNR